MSIARRSVRTATYIFISRLIALVANIAAVLLVTRYLGKVGFGQYAFVMAYSLFIGALAAGGVAMILIRETARERERAGENLGTSIQVQVVFSLVAAGLALSVMRVFTSDPLVQAAIQLSVVATVIQVMANLFASLFTAFEDTLYMTIAVFIERALFLGGIILIVTQGWSFLSIFWTQVVSFSVKLVFCVAVVRLRFTRVVWKLSRQRFVFFFRESVPLLFSTGFQTLDAQLDTLMLQLLNTAAQLGLYNAPYRVLARLSIIPDSLMAGLLPALSNLVRSDRRQAAELYRRIFKYFIVTSLPIAVVVSLLSAPLMLLLFGADYIDGAATLSILIWAVIFSFPNYLFSYLLTALGKQRLDTRRLALSLVIHAALSVVLIPRLGAAGAASTMLVGQIVAFIAGYLYVSREVGAWYPWGLLAKLAGGALPAVAIIKLWTAGPAAAQFAFAGLAYFVALALMGVFERKEIEVLVQAIRPSGRRGPAGLPADTAVAGKVE